MAEVDVEASDYVAEDFQLSDFLPPDEKANRTKASAQNRSNGSSGGDMEKKKVYEKTLRFVVVKRLTGDTEKNWSVVEADEVADMINDIMTEIADEDSNALKCYAWLDQRKGILALKPDSRKRIEVFREKIRNFSPIPVVEDDGSDEDMDTSSQLEIPATFQYETYLMDALIERYSVTILIKKNNRKLPLDKIASLLFKRNKKLRGTLTPIKCKYYNKEDKNQNGTSREDWRLVHLEGDEAFMASLATFPENQFFPFGSANIQIRGGKRPPGSNKSSNQTSRAGTGLATGSNMLAINPESVRRILGGESDRLLSSEEAREKSEFADELGKKRAWK